MVLEKVLVYLYSGEMDVEDLNLGALMDLLDLLNLMNLSMEFSSAQDFTFKKIRSGLFPYSDCLKCLAYDSKLCLRDFTSSTLPRQQFCQIL